MPAPILDTTATRQVIGANVHVLWPRTPGYYTPKVLSQHKNHVHIGWGYWP